MFAASKTAGAVSAEVNYIEDVFSTYLYTGNNTTQTITNGIDVSTKGGLVWIKDRTTAANNYLFDTERGATSRLFSNLTNAAATSSSTAYFQSFNNNGFTVGYANSDSASNYASWTFRKQPKFFDVVTYTGNATTRTIAHNLGSAPGVIIVKDITNNSNWQVYHQSLGATQYIVLNSTLAAATASNRWNDTAPTSSVFTIGDSSTVNTSGATYVAYLFAHNAGGFGLTGTDNVISCGSFTDTTTVNLGYEPQWVLFKKSSSSSIGDWFIADNMRGFSETSINTLSANTSSAEASYSGTGCVLTSTGFTYNTGLAGSGTFIYIAIRRGPMKVPTSGTSVFSPVTYTGNGSSQSLTAGFPIDLSLFKYRGGSTNSFEWFDRLRGTSPDLRSAYTYAELATTTEVTSFASNTQVTVGASSDTGGTNASGQTYVLEAFRRAPSFFDEVCFNGSDTDFTVNHNLQAIPELIILKKRSGTGSWFVGGTIVGFNSANNNNNLFLNNTNAISTATVYTATWTSSAMYMSGGANFVAGTTAVAYLFATCAGVSKVGSYTGTGTLQTINCGFTGGARFVLIKRTDTTGDWYVWDTARGMVSGTDPSLLLNSTAAEVNANSIYTTTGGFQIVSTAAGINASGGIYIFFAVA